MRRLKVWLLRVVAQPSRARVSRALKEDKRNGIRSIMFSDGEYGYMRNY